MKLRSALIIPDTHVPHEDRRAFSLMLKIAEKIKSQISEIVFIGDFAEYETVSRWDRVPGSESLLKNEIEFTNKYFNKIDSVFSKQKKVFIEGNHENRLTRYLINQAPSLFGLVDTFRLFEIQKRRWEWIPYGPRQSYNILDTKLVGRHEPIGKDSRSTSFRAGSDIIFGHIHNFEESAAGTIQDQTFIATSCGFLGDQKKEIFDYAKQKNWELGFCFVHSTSPTNYWIEKVRIKKDYTAYALGEIFKG